MVKWLTLAQTLAQTGIMGLVDQFKYVAPGRARLTGYVVVYMKCAPGSAMLLERPSGKHSGHSFEKPRGKREKKGNKGIKK